ncbi:MAG: hypothetical protein ACLUD0_05560 [Eubacterium ramulus]
MWLWWIPKRTPDITEGRSCVLFDIKGLDRERHKANTGVDNEIIWKNLRMLGKWQKPVIVRIPVIPGYNDDMQELSDIFRTPYRFRL